MAETIRSTQEDLERKVPEQELTIEAMTGSLKELERKLRSLQEAINLLPKTNEEVIGSYGEG